MSQLQADFEEILRRVQTFGISFATAMQEVDENENSQLACLFPDCHKRFNDMKDFEIHMTAMHLSSSSFNLVEPDSATGHYDVDILLQDNFGMKMLRKDLQNFCLVWEVIDSTFSAWICILDPKENVKKYGWKISSEKTMVYSGQLNFPFCKVNQGTIFRQEINQGTEDASIHLHVTIEENFKARPNFKSFDSTHSCHYYIE